MVYYVLLEVDKDPVIVKTPDVEYPNLYAKHEFCHKIFSSAITCNVLKVYRENEFNEKKLVGHYIVKCGRRIVKDDIVILEKEEELEDVKKDYEDLIKEYEYDIYYDAECHVEARLHKLTLAELDLVDFYKRYKGYNTSLALIKASLTD